MLPIRSRSAIMVSVYLAAVLSATLCLCSPAWAERTLQADTYADKLRGMWFGELVGNYAGRQVEGLVTVTYEGPNAVSKPITDYQVQWNTILGGQWYDKSGTLKGDITKWLGDDDTCFEFLYVHALQSLSSLSVTERTNLWTSNVVFSGIYIANRQAWWQINTYGRSAVQAGSPRYNIHAGWAIDSQITTESLGAIAPGMRNRASTLADEFGGISNRGYPLHAAQFYAAMYAEAALSTDVETLVTRGLQAVPSGSWTRSLIEKAVELYQADRDDNGSLDNWLANRNAVIAFAHQRGRNRSWVESASNTALATLAILYGQGSFVATVEFGVRGGEDSDCNPATAGGLVGLMNGYTATLAELTIAGYDANAIPQSYYSSSTVTGLAKTVWTLDEVVDILQAATQTQITDTLGPGAITGSGASKQYHLPDSNTGADALSPAPCDDPAGPGGLVGEVLDMGGTVTVVVKRNGVVQANNSATDRSDQSRLIDGVVDLSCNGVLPFSTNSWVASTRTDTYELHFDREIRFEQMILHEGDIIWSGTNSDPQDPNYQPYGGYFTGLSVEVLHDANWIGVTNLALSEALDPYVYFQSIELTFDPLSGQAIRVLGPAGGQRPFTTLRELEAFGTILTGDLNDDGAVDIVDLNMVLIDWSRSGAAITDSRSDANGDGTVDIVDLNTVLIDWGK